MDGLSTQFIRTYGKKYVSDINDPHVSDAMSPVNLYSCGREGLVAKTPLGPFSKKFYLIFVGEGGKATYRIDGEKFPVERGKMCIVYPNEEFYINIDKTEP